MFRLVISQIAFPQRFVSVPMITSILSRYAKTAREIQIKRLATSWLNRNGYPIATKYVHSIAYGMIAHGVTKYRYKEVIAVWHSTPDHKERLIKHSDKMTKGNDFLVDCNADQVDLGMIAKNHFVHALRLYEHGGMYYEHKPSEKIIVPGNRPSIAEALTHGITVIPIDEVALEDDEAGLLAIMLINNIDNWATMSDHEVQLVLRMNYLKSLVRPLGVGLEAFVLEKHKETGGETGAFNEVDVKNCLAFACSSQPEDCDDLEQLHIYSINPQQFSLPCSYFGVFSMMPAKYMGQ